MFPSIDRRGFTSHEHLDNLNLVHMNGRVYAPVIGRFLSADPFIPALYNSQALNRYSYVYNNPLSYTDPSGFDPDRPPSWGFCFGCEPGSRGRFDVQQPRRTFHPRPLRQGASFNSIPPSGMPTDFVQGSMDSTCGASSAQVAGAGPGWNPQANTCDATFQNSNREELEEELGIKRTLPSAAATVGDIASKTGDVVEETYEATLWGGLFSWLSRWFKFGKVVDDVGARGDDAADALGVLRQRYVNAVSGLGGRATEMRRAGMSTEQIARALHAERRILGEQYKALTPPDKLAEIYRRNQDRYGDKLGPSIEWLRSQGKSWEQIIESASRAGGKDLGL